MVKAVVNKYQDHGSDHSGDFWDYSPDVFNDLFGGAKFIFCTREMSDEIETKLNEWVEPFNISWDNEHFNCRQPSEAVRKMFYYNSFTNSNFEIVHTEKTFCTNSPEELFEIKY